MKKKKAKVCLEYETSKEGKVKSSKKKEPKRNSKGKSVAKKSLMKKVQQEWKKLKKSNPNASLKSAWANVK